MKKFCMSYSLGKDSTLALYEMIEDGNIPVALIVAINKNQERSWFHGVQENLIKKVSLSLDIPVIFAAGIGEDYKEVFVEALKEAKELGAEICAFGDIDIEEHREWGTSICETVNMDAAFPLWKRSRKTVVEKIIDCNFKCMIKTVTKEHNVPKEYLGRILDRQVVSEFEDLGIDVCGENGEYHTFVVDGPIFSTEIDVKQIGVHESEYSYSLIIE